jgi:hypothetical protein
LFVFCVSAKFIQQSLGRTKVSLSNFGSVSSKNTSSVEDRCKSPQVEVSINRWVELLSSAAANKVGQRTTGAFSHHGPRHIIKQKKKKSMAPLEKKGKGKESGTPTPDKSSQL